jgi:hypothetical protein
VTKATIEAGRNSKNPRNKEKTGGKFASQEGKGRERRGRGTTTTGGGRQAGWPPARPRLRERDTEAAKAKREEDRG